MGWVIQVFLRGVHKHDLLLALSTLEWQDEIVLVVSRRSMIPMVIGCVMSYSGPPSFMVANSLKYGEKRVFLRSFDFVDKEDIIDSKSFGPESVFFIETEGDIETFQPSHMWLFDRLVQWCELVGIYMPDVYYLLMEEGASELVITKLIRSEAYEYS